MTEKRLGGFVDSVFARHLKHEQDYSDALWTTAYAELLNAGFDADAILRWSRHGRRPSDELLQRKVDAATAGNSTLEPLSIDAYKRCFHILTEMMDFDELLDDINSQEIDDPRILAAVMFDCGLAIGLESNLIGWEMNETITERGLQAKRGRQKRGTTSSLARIAIDYALSNGQSTGAQVRNYLETEPVIDDIEIEVFKNEDEFGHLTGFTFHHIPSGKSSSLFKIASLAPTVSIVRKKLSEKRSLRDSGKH